MQPPRRPRKTSVGVVGVLLRAGLVVALVALVAWPETHGLWLRLTLSKSDPIGRRDLTVLGRRNSIVVKDVRQPTSVEGCELGRDSSLSVILPSGD